jgi:methyl coenzyme M reductase beta subunit
VRDVAQAAVYVGQRPARAINDTICSCTVEYFATIVEVAPGEHGVDGLNAVLQTWTSVGWSLHSQSIAMDAGIDKILAMVVFERQSRGDG